MDGQAVECLSRSAGGAGRPRVLMVVESCGGGTGRHFIELAQGLLERGCDVHLLFSLGRVDHLFLDKLAALQGVHCKQLPMRRGLHPSDLAVVRRARRYLKEEGPFDVIHGHSSKGGAIARLMAIGTGVPAFYTLHGFGANDPTMARWKRMFYLVVELALARLTRRVIAVSPEERRAAIRLGLGRSRVACVPNGIRPSEMAPRAAARAALGAADDELVIGFVGRLVSQKAPHVLVGAMRRVAAELPRARLVMVGAGPLEADLRRLAADLGVADRIAWLGERDARGLMAGFDVFAISSRVEGLPYVVLEAMSAGLPVVATETAGVECLVETGVNGTVVPCEDAEAFADALVAMGREPAKLAAYGRASLERVSKFTVEEMVEQTLACYAGAIPEGLAADAARLAAEATEGAAPGASRAAGDSETGVPAAEVEECEVVTT